MKHTRAEMPDRFQLVRADGSVPRPWDVEQPVLHLLAKLRVRSETLDACRSPGVSCTATVLQPTDGVQVPRELVMRQPLPIQRHFVRQAHSYELAGRVEGQAQPQGPTEISRMGHCLSQSLAPAISVSALQAIALPDDTRR